MPENQNSKEPSSKPDVEEWIKARGNARESVALTVVIPAYNEYLRLPSTLMEMVDYFDKRVANGTLPSYEIIVVDDGSSDQTAELVRKFEKIRGEVSLIRSTRNCGKGHAVKLGMLNAHGDNVLFADADGSTPIEESERLLAAIDEGFDIAIGSRAKQSTSTKVKARFHRKVIGRFFNFVVNMVVLPGLEDTQCGFKMFTKKAAHFIFEKQQSDGFSFDVEILFIALRCGLKIKEVPVNWHNVAGSKVNLVVDALKMLRDIFVFRVRHRALKASDFVEAESARI